MRPGLITDAIDLNRTASAVRALGTATTNSHETLGFYSSVVDHLPFACLGFTKAGVVQFSNLSGVQLIGVERHELLGRQFATFISDADRPHFSNLLGKAFATHQKQVCDLKLLPVGRAPVYVRIEASVAPNSTECMAALVDISEHKQAELSRDIRNLAIQAVNQGIVIADPTQPNCPIIYVNDGFESMTGYTATEAIGRSFEFLQGRDTNPTSVAEMYAAFCELRTCTVELLHYRKNGTMFWNEMQFAPVCDESGKLLQYIGFMSDVTQRRNMEERLRHSQKMEAVGQLAGGIAHGFNNLLTVIEGYTGLLLDAPAVFANRSQEFLTEIRSATSRAAELTQQLLALGRRQLLHPLAFDLNELVSESLQGLGTDTIEVQANLDPQLHQVWADRAQIAQALTNLIHNALDALADGGRLAVCTQCVDLSAADVTSLSQIPPGKYALLSVSDNGCGMSEEVLARAFEPFFTTKPLGKGTGLGLSAVHGVVSQSGGHVDVTSKPGIGTCVNLYLPQEKMPLDSTSQQTKPPSPKSGTETILLVEDENAVRNIVRIVLTRYGYKVLEAANGNEALEIVSSCESPIHMLLTDVVMPGMHGPEVAKAVVSQIPAIRVIYMSGYVDDARTREGLADPTASFIQKPFSSEDLAHKVRAILDA
ncbi:MAG: PAS domain-containing protein [Pirellulaceae bacterium]|nr:PAS domain-containing protein [Pirellulaceae bacterium]